MEQHPEEFSWLLDTLREVQPTSILEVGSRGGDALRTMATAVGARAYSIDIVAMADSEGIEQYVGDSRSPEAVAWAQARSPFGFVFIDADHTTVAVTMDWLNYGKMSRVVGFHDIAGRHEGVSPLWDYLKESYTTSEKVCVPDAMGIGIIWT